MKVKTAPFSAFRISCPGKPSGATLTAFSHHEKFLHHTGTPCHRHHEVHHSHDLTDSVHLTTSLYTSRDDFHNPDAVAQTRTDTTTSSPGNTHRPDVTAVTAGGLSIFTTADE